MPVLRSALEVASESPWSGWARSRAPGGGTWTWGPDGARDMVTGPALDFCLAVTQRRHVDDTTLRITGPVAAEWMGIAQAFAGPPGPGRAPGRSVKGSEVT